MKKIYTKPAIHVEMVAMQPIMLIVNSNDFDFDVPQQAKDRRREDEEEESFLDDGGVLGLW